MADIDMIPRSYREQLRVEGAVRRYGIALAALLLLAFLASLLLRWQVARTEPLLAIQRTELARAGGDSGKLAALQARQVALEQSVAALDALRAAGTVGRLTEALDRSLGADLWLTSIRYARNEQLLPAAGAAGPASPAAGDANSFSVQAAGVTERWRVTRRIDLGGAASTYPALTEFMRGFAGQGGVADVHLVDSASAADAANPANPANSGKDANASIAFNVTALAGAAGAQP